MLHAESSILRQEEFFLLIFAVEESIFQSVQGKRSRCVLILADAGYSTLQKFTKTAERHLRKKNCRLSEEEKAENRNLSKKRIRVEHIFRKSTFSGRNIATEEKGSVSDSILLPPAAILQQDQHKRIYARGLIMQPRSRGRPPVFAPLRHRKSVTPLYNLSPISLAAQQKLFSSCCGCYFPFAQPKSPLRQRVPFVPRLYRRNLMTKSRASSILSR